MFYSGCVIRVFCNYAVYKYIQDKIMNLYRGMNAGIVELKTPEDDQDVWNVLLASNPAIYDTFIDIFDERDNREKQLDSECID